VSSLKELQRNLTKANGVVAGVLEPTRAADGAVGSIKKIVDEPGKLAKGLGKVAKELKAMGEVAKLLSPLPVIGTILSRAAPMAIKAAKAVTKLKGICNKADAKLKKLKVKKVVGAISKPLSSAKKKLESAQARLATSIALVKHFEEEYGEHLPQVVEQAVSTVNSTIGPAIDGVERVEGNLKPGLKAVTAAGNAATSALAPVTNAIDVVAEIQNSLGVFMSPIESVMDALKKLGPIKWILRMIRRLSDVITKIINEVLRALGVNLDALLNQLERALIPLADLVKPLKAKLDTLLGSLTKIDALKASDLVKLVEAVASLESSLAPLSKASVRTQVLAGTRAKAGSSRTKRRSKPLAAKRASKRVSRR